MKNGLVRKRFMKQLWKILSLWNETIQRYIIKKGNTNKIKTQKHKTDKI